LETDLGFIIDPKKGDKWTQSFKVRSKVPLFQANPTVEEIEDATETLMADINQTNEVIFKCRRPPHRRASPWWNAACSVATQNLRRAQTTETRGIAQARLKGTVRVVKRQWVDDYIEKSQLWELAMWRHGQRVSKVPSLQGPEGLVHIHEEIADILSQQFFPQAPPRVETFFGDDPPPQTIQTLPAIDEELIDSLLAKTTNKSVPGQSGQTWTILKWVWTADPTRLLALFKACLKAGHHPRPWKEAVVCVIPKPHRADYSRAKNFRPISLLECLGKLLEKIVAKIIYREMNKHALVPTTQFGGRNASSTLDAGLSLLHDIQAAHKTGLRTGLLLFDIQGYFNNINHERLIQVFASLGFVPELVQWCHSFLKDRLVRLRFNGRSSDPFEFSVGTPQGSPVSPVLSMIYTSPLLHKMRSWTNTSLGMYVDDGAIFSCGRQWEDIENSLCEGYTTCLDWLTRAGLSAELEKMELIYFRKRGEKSDPPHHISLPLPTPNMQYKVTTTNTLRYLGFFFNSRLSWTHHVEVMCNRARASLKALQLLGNSVRGLDQARWRLAYNAICLLVLTYGSQLWFTGKQVTLVKKLQVVQNDTVRLISGTFRTTPREPLHQLLNILPMDLRLKRILLKMALRLYKAPKGSQLLIRIGGAWHQPAATDLPLPASNRASLKSTLWLLANRVPANGPRIDPFPEIPLGAPDWGGKVKVIRKQKEWDYKLVTNTLTTACHEGSTINIFCNGARSNKGHLDSKQIGATSAALYQEGKEKHHAERVLGESVTEQDIMLRSLHSGLDVLTSLLVTQPSQQHKPITIALAAETALSKALDASPHEDQAESIRLLVRLNTTIAKYPSIQITLLWLPKNI
jgi:Reverse transcriptase (RNA-dependent DNA polymerase)